MIKKKLCYILMSFITRIMKRSPIIQTFVVDLNRISVLTIL